MVTAAHQSLAKRIVPLVDRVLVQRLKPVEKTAAGLFIPEKSQESINRGVVLAVGPGSEKDKVTLKVGENVILPGYGGTTIKDKDEEYYLFRESEILAKISE